MELNKLNISQAIEGLKKKHFSALELTKACLSRIKKIDPKIKAFITVCYKKALKEAVLADNLINQDNFPNNKPLLGIPIAVKDNFCTQGIKTTASAKVLSDFIPPYDATVIQKLKKAGAIIIGKTNMDAWAHGSSTETSDFFTTRNPWNTNHLPGGSSGGSAAAIAADMAIAAIGSETAGSIRQPASWCGVTGLKPTYGRISRYGLISMCSSTDCPGPLTKNANDAGLLMEILSGKDICDATSTPNQYRFKLIKNLRNIKIGLPKQYFLKQAQKEVLEKTKLAIKVLEKLGAKISWVNILDPKYSVAVYTIIQRSEVSSNLARYDGIRYGLGRKFFGEEAKRRIILGTYTLSSGYYDQYYLKAQLARTLIIKDFNKVFGEVDLLLAPSTPSTALKIGATQNNSMFGELQDILFEASSLAGLPAISLPCGFDQNQLPIGMQLIAKQNQENLILSTANLYQQATDWHQQKPKI
jgi:aspartyl-tRNA(Asn)/glutamyl-tRNA(Gln) amidotransferase subunit A